MEVRNCVTGRKCNTNWFICLHCNTTRRLSRWLLNTFTGELESPKINNRELRTKLLSSSEAMEAIIEIE